MSDSDRIRVPTNGHRVSLETLDSPVADEPPSKALAGQDLRIAFTPGQLAAGFGILAGLILVLVGTRRRPGADDLDADDEA
jgi:hypothetical protein